MPSSDQIIAGSMAEEASPSASGRRPVGAGSLPRKSKGKPNLRVVSNMPGHDRITTAEVEVLVGYLRDDMLSILSP